MYEQKLIIQDILKHYGIDICYQVAIGLLHICDAKNWLVKQEYQRLYSTGNYTYKEIKDLLSKRYDISVSCIEKIIYRD